MTTPSRNAKQLKPDHHRFLASHRISVASVVVACFLIVAYALDADRDFQRAGSVPIELVKALSLGDEADQSGVIFGRIGGLIAVDGQGRIFVGEGQDPQIYAFNAQGDLITSIGTEGEGPGEFIYVSAVHTGPGDTLYVFDSSRMRISAFDPVTLDLAYDFMLSEDSAGRSATEFIGVVDMGFVMGYEDLARPGTEFRSDRFVYAKISDWQGQVAFDPTVRVPALAWMVLVDGDLMTAVTLPFGRDPIFRIGPNEHIYAGSTESVDINISAPDGSSRNPIVHQLEDIPITQSELDEHLENWSVSIYRRLRSFEFPKTKPAFSTFVVDDKGRTWIKLTKPDPESATAKWLIVDTESEVVGHLDLPYSINLQVVAAGRAYAVDYADGVVLAVYDIVE